MLPARGRHGGRQAVYNHLRNLAEAKEPISIDLVVVDIDNSGEILPSDIAVDNYWIFDREFPSWREKGGKIAALKQLFFDLRPRAAALAYSVKAQKWLQERLKGVRYDVIVLEHANGWAMVDDSRTTTPIAYIAQNIEEEIVRDELRQIRPTSLHWFRVLIEVWKTRYYEKSLLLNVNKVLCISSYDAEKLAHRNLSASVLAWPELPQVRQVKVRDWRGRRLLFVGSPGHFPNIEAARWLACNLMPRIRTLCLDTQLHIVGCAKADISGEMAVDGVIFEGFVTKERLDELHRIAEIFVCPVVLGSGVKIKVLEAVAFGLPIVASIESLRGIDFLLGNAVTITRDVGAAATRIVDLLNSPETLRKMSESGQIALRDAILKRKNLSEVI